MNSLSHTHTFVLVHLRAKIKETADLAQKVSNDNMEAQKRSSFSKEATATQKDSVTVASTQVVSTELVFTQHCNHHGTLFGGQVLEWMSSVATISASRLRKGFCVLKSIDDVHFVESALQGERVVI